ncbi:MAG TPA: response regulator [Spirochaetia bacterium]|nr:response regulator [Spirochaetia bacterium]
MVQILLVEDEDMILKGLQYTVDWLSMDANIIAVAENGQVGLEKIREFHPDIVITDIKMPVMDGLEMIEHAMEEGIPFLPIVLTSYSDFTYAKESIRLQVFDYLLKPVDNVKLAELIRRATTHLEKERGLRMASGLAETAGSGTGTIVLNSPITNPYVKYALEKIETGYQKHLNIESIAAELRISTSYLSRVFKQQCGHTFLDFLNRYRVCKAIEFLSTGKYRVYEVAERCGFCEYKRFYQIFHEYTDVSPTEFIKNGCCVIKKSR